MPDLDFEFYAGAIEDGMLEVLEAPMRAIGVKSFATYSGQIDDAASLKAAISSQVLQFPFVMVSYAGGESRNQPPTSKVDGKPRHHRHECTFSVIVADNNPQGEKARRRGKVYKMIAVVWETLVGVRLKKQVEDAEVLLNVEPFDEPENIRIIGPDITAFGILFDTAFKWSSPDRTEAGVDVTELVVGVESLNQAGERRVPPELPGVSSTVGS